MAIREKKNYNAIEGLKQAALEVKNNLNSAYIEVIVDVEVAIFVKGKDVMVEPVEAYDEWGNKIQFFSDLPHSEPQYRGLYGVKL